MNEQHIEELFLQQARRVLDASVENLGDDVSSRLAMSRRAALKSRKAPHSQGIKWLRFAFAGFVVAALIWIAGVLFIPERNEIAAGATIEDLEIVTSGENPDFYRDIDFYLWLSTKKEKVSAVPAGWSSLMAGHHENLLENLRECQNGRKGYRNRVYAAHKTGKV
jgi:hypothetical protein